MSNILTYPIRLKLCHIVDINIYAIYKIYHLKLSKTTQPNHFHAYKGHNSPLNPLNKLHLDLTHHQNQRFTSMNNTQKILFELFLVSPSPVPLTLPPSLPPLTRTTANIDLSNVSTIYMFSITKYVRGKMVRKENERREPNASSVRGSGIHFQADKTEGCVGICGHCSLVVSSSLHANALQQQAAAAVHGWMGMPHLFCCWDMRGARLLPSDA
jgi:hypothetical protein